MEKNNISHRLLNPPINVPLFETPISTHWFDESGILCAVSKKVERTIEHYQAVNNLYKTLIQNNQKLCLLADTHDTMPISKEVRNFMTSEMPKYIKAHAIVTSVPLTSSLTSTFMKFNFLDFPVKLFSNVEEAKEWLKEYL